ncbi:MAG: hypothetical protein R6U04_12345 [Bacteroidales bacterium]
MKQKSKDVIVDTSCLILLQKIEELNILKHLFGKIRDTDFRFSDELFALLLKEAGE